MNIKQEMRFLSVFILLTLIKVNVIFTQCSSTISNFPYNEGFEASASWTSGGTASDWAWGTPSHPLISSAGSGNKAWNAGDLSGSSYNANQQSYLASPCFDFSSLTAPWISFKLFWEVEYMWDGATFQYSTDEGSSWTNVGAYNDPIDCFNDNWFNYNNVNWLTSANPKHGWTGRVGSTVGSCSGGQGSAQWLEAKHCLSDLAGAPSVKFRFLFGSGNSCNSYDGFAVDDILIQNASSNIINFTYQCLAANQISFTANTDNCVSNFNWNFNDPNTTASISNDENPVHSFSEGGNFNVILTTIGSCNQETSISKIITVLPSNINKTDVTCKGLNNGTASVSALSTSSYLWNNNPSQTASSISSLSPGNYSVVISDPSACSITENISISEPNELTLSSSVTNSCENQCNGSLSLNANGGTAPYTYSWNNLIGGQIISGNVCEGLYTGFVSDFNGCETTTTATVNTFPNPTIQVNSANICIGSNAILNVAGASTYQWKPNSGLNTAFGATVTANPPITTEYTIIGTSIQGCIDSITTLVSVSDVFAPKANFSFSPNNPTIYDNEISFFNLSEDATNYEWDFYDEFQTIEVNPTYSFPNNDGNSYLVCLTAVNDVNCTNEKCEIIKIEGIPSVYVPNTFSPNGDQHNNSFFPVLRDIEIDNYEFSIYNRWGELIFNSTNISASWDGKYHNEDCPNGSYQWTLIYSEKDTGKRELLTGSILLQR